MKFAVNYSPQAARLLDDGAIDVDLYKCPDWPHLVATAQAQRPAYIHFPMLAGRNDIEKTGWGKIDTLLSSTATPYVNTHLAPRISDFPGMPLDTADPVHTERLVAAMFHDIGRLTA
jgi:uncharacterized protein